jgi:hypothetical protein
MSVELAPARSAASRTRLLERFLERTNPRVLRVQHVEYLVHLLAQREEIVLDPCRWVAGVSNAHGRLDPVESRVERCEARLDRRCYKAPQARPRT